MPISLTGYIVYRVMRIIWSCLPHRRPVAGTKVRVNSYTHSGEWDKPSPLFNGSVVGPEYQFVGPFEQRRGYPHEGTYFCGDERWPMQWVVRIDDEDGTLEQHDLPGNELVSDYRWGIPLIDRLVARLTGRNISSRIRRIGDLPHPIEYYKGDFVVYAKDETQTPRMVRDVWFRLDGVPMYNLVETLSERKARYADIKAAAEAKGRSWMISGGPELKFKDVLGSELTLSRRGNFFHVAHGQPEDLSFPNVTLEVDFWRSIGIWLNDRDHTRISIPASEVPECLSTGRIDTVHTGRNTTYSPIVLPERFATFRERSRKASLEYVSHYRGKYAFDVVPRNVIDEYEQSDL